MEEVIKLEHVDLIYKTNESLSLKKVITNLYKKNNGTSLLNQYKALNDVSFTIEKGKVYGLIGNNGAGKSTLLKVLSGVISPNTGIVQRNYETINLLALGVGFSGEISGWDNIILNGLLLGFSKEEIVDKMDSIIEYSEIKDFIYKPMKTYSSGMKSRLGFAIAINLKPDVLLIDEVLSVGDIHFKEKSFQSIKDVIFDDKITVVIVSHSVNQLKELCDTVIWLEKGNIVEIGEAEKVLADYMNKK